MMKNFLLRTVLFQTLVEWLLVTETVSESYTRSYDGYVFTSPGLSEYRKRDDAQTWCTQNGSKLLEINNSYVQKLTVWFLRDAGVYFPDELLLFTNGIRDDGSSWNWVNGQDINSITITGQGPDLVNSFGYINVSPSRLYIAASIPTTMRGYICQGKFDCTNGFLLNEMCHKSYSSPTMSWFDARNRCLDEGGDLASFDFINDDQGLNSTLNGSWLSSSTAYWIGLRRQWWTWQTSNREVRYSNWLNGRPVYRLENRCLCLSKSGIDWKWIECSCDNAFPFVCLTEPPTTPFNSSSTTRVRPTISTAKTTTLSGFRNITDTYSNPSTMEPPLSTVLGLGSTGLALAIGLGIGIPAVLVILALSVVIALMKKKLSYQTNTTGVVDTVTHTQLPVKRNPQMAVNGSLEMVTEQSTSPYESLQQDGTTISDGHYQELLSSGRREANGPETIDYEPVRG